MEAQYTSHRVHCFRCYDAVLENTESWMDPDREGYRLHKFECGCGAKYNLTIRNRDYLK